MPDRRRLELLLVEDDALVRVMLAMLLEDHGFHVVEAATGEAALRLIEGGPVLAALVTDVHLGPGIDGFVLAEGVRVLWPGLPVVFVTGRTGTPDRPHRAGEACLVKPFDGDALAGLVRDLAAA